MTDPAAVFFFAVINVIVLGIGYMISEQSDDDAAWSLSKLLSLLCLFFKVAFVLFVLNSMFWVIIIFWFSVAKKKEISAAEMRLMLKRKKEGDRGRTPR